MQNESNNEVVVVMPDETGKPVATVMEVANPNESESVVEEIIDAIFDPFGSDDTATDAATAPITVVEPVMIVEPVIVAPVVDGEWGATDALDTADLDLSTGISSPDETGDVVTAEPDSADAAAEAEAQAHADAATDLQSKADDAIGKGDYAAAAELRESAENEAWTAGTSDMLHGSDSTRLESAADQQAKAEEFEREEGQHAAAGDYEAARDDASHAASAMGDADFNAGASDHTGQADAEYQEMDWAVSEEHLAEQDAQSAEGYAEAGLPDSAEVYAESAIDHQESADEHGDLGEHGGDLAVDDSSSAVEHDSYVDTSSSVDTSVDTSSTYDDTSSSVDS